MKLFIYSIVLLLGCLHGYYAQHNYCLESAVCNLLRGDVFIQKGEDTPINSPHYKTADKEFEKHLEFGECGVTDILYKCKKRLNRCVIDLINDMNIKYAISRQLLAKCHFDSYQYLVFLCKNIQDWPTKITDLFGDAENICHKACIEMDAFNTYHEINGITVFPKDWTKRRFYYINLRSR